MQEKNESPVFRNEKYIRSHLKCIMSQLIKNVHKIILGDSVYKLWNRSGLATFNLQELLFFCIMKLTLRLRTYESI